MALQHGQRQKDYRWLPQPKEVDAVQFSEMPLISCIMPTRNRHLFVGQAIWYFQKQDYPNKELLVLDDGEDTVENLIPDDPHIKYIRLNKRLSLGAKRNLACEMSNGELIAHWDDDDWVAPKRLSTQVKYILNSNASVCGLSNVLYYQPNTGKAWYYRYPDNQRPWLAGGTLLYRRSAWETNQFPEIDVGEDTEFIWRLPPDCLQKIENKSLYIGIIHDRNTATKCLQDERWESRPLDEVGRLLEFDRDFYVALRRGGKKVSVPNYTDQSQVNLAAPFIVYDGYGSMAEYLALGMQRSGANVNVVPLELDLNGISTEFQELYQRSKPNDTGVVLYFCWPRADLERFRFADNLFIYTMWEGSRLPKNWVPALNQARAVIVPTRFVEKVCRDSGVTVPVEVVPQGIDPDVYHYIERPNRKGITTLIVGTVIGRKHTQEGIDAWKLAFTDDPDARLIIKSRFQYNNYVPDDPRIQFVDTNEATRGIAKWYEQTDVLLALGNEGFGLPLVEAMATGLPVIALNSEGQSDICEDAKELLLPVDPCRWEPSDEKPFGPGGVRGVPSVKQVADKLRWVADNRQAAIDLGRAASKWALQHRNLKDFGPRVLDALERYVYPKRPLRRNHTLWVPSWKSACGIAEYSAHLTEHMPNAQITGTVPDMRGVRVLHVQHEHSLISDADMLQAVYDAKRRNVPVIITEHAVGRMARSWEREADIIISHTKQGVDILRDRLPEKRIEHIPHGCHEWFPARKRSRGRTIGVFGFLGRHKGFWRLLEVLRQLRGTELVMFSHARDEHIEADWAQAAAGLAVRRYRNYLPTKTIATRLAAQADILVYWYEDNVLDAVSGAVRIGLASGVPVLASPVSWFKDVAEVTYQPEFLVEGVQRLLEDTALQRQLVGAAREYCHENSWSRIADRHLHLWRDLAGN